MEALTRRQNMYLTLQSWASIAPLMACILGPLSILLGIPALSQRWRGYVDVNVVTETLPDPGLNIILASMSLACEVFANFILMLRFSSIAVPLTTSLSLALWVAKVAICLGNYVQFIVVHPQPHDLDRNWIYLEGFWIGCASMVISAIVILFLALNLIITPARHDLGIHEKAIMEQHRLAHRGFMIRVLILVVSMGFGSLAFSKLEDFSFVTGLYLVTASILTVGFGDVVLTKTASKIILFPYLVFSVTYVALMVTSIAGMIDERLDAQKQLREHLRQVTKTTEKQQAFQLQQALGVSNLLMLPNTPRGAAEMKMQSYGKGEENINGAQSSSIGKSSPSSSDAGEKYQPHVKSLALQRTLTLQQEIEEQAGMLARREHHRQLRNIFLALLFFSIFWFVGALVFKFSEGWPYGEAMYFCYVFFMTVGYGDYSPKSQLGRVLFIVYAMIAVPTVTFLVQVFVEAADVKKYVYNSKKSRQRRIEELDTRDIDEIKRHVTQDNQSNVLIGLRRARSMSRSDGVDMRSRTMSRTVTIENDKSATLTQTIRLTAPTSPRSPRSRSQSIAVSDSPLSDTEKIEAEATSISTSDEAEDEDQDLAAELLDSEVASRSSLLQHARKLDHLTRLLISPHLHHEARLLLSLEMGHLDNHYRRLLRTLRQSNPSSSMDREWMEDTKEAEWLGLTGLERERKFVLEYRECFASLLSDVENLVGDLTPVDSCLEVKKVCDENLGENETSLEGPIISKSNNVDQRSGSGIRWAH